MTKLSIIFASCALALVFVMSALHPASSGAPLGTGGIKGDGQSLLIKIKKNKPLNCKKAKCAADEIKLDKPNVYGACCQASGSITPAPKAEQKCKFPGEVGPNCDCPKYTEFLGYKGCVPFKWNCVAPGVLDYTMYASNEDEARGQFLARVQAQNYNLNNTKVTCKKVYPPN